MSPNCTRHICTTEDPWTPEKSKRGQHPDAKEVGEQMPGWPGGDIQAYECPHCGLYFEVELPQ